MADTKVSNLTALLGSAAESTDLVPVIDLSAGTAGSKKMTIAELGSGLNLVGGLAKKAGTDALTVTLTALGTTPTAGFSLINTTAAAAGAQQVSPSLVWTGQGWKTDSGGASQQVDFRANVLPVQSSAAPAGNWQLQAAINGGAFSNVALVSSAGSLRATGLSAVLATEASSGEVRFSNGGFLATVSHGGFYSSADGVMVITNAALTGFSRFCLGTATSSSPSLKRSSAAMHVRLADDSAFAELVFLLPTANPGAGTLWNNAGTLTVGT